MIGERRRKCEKKLGEAAKGGKRWNKWNRLTKCCVFIPPDSH